MDSRNSGDWQRDELDCSERHLCALEKSCLWNRVWLLAAMFLLVGCMNEPNLESKSALEVAEDSSEAGDVGQVSDALEGSDVGGGVDTIQRHPRSLIY